MRAFARALALVGALAIALAACGRVGPPLRSRPAPAPAPVPAQTQPEPEQADEEKEPKP